ncbi:MAG: hypothetical protein LUC40_04260, partial [Oscillospiraceae bacterium]|nr:hypothetical protein [Oscillospiraceae bacterium]
RAFAYFPHDRKAGRSRMNETCPVAAATKPDQLPQERTLPASAHCDPPERVEIYLYFQKRAK